MRCCVWHFENFENFIPWRNLSLVKSTFPSHERVFASFVCVHAEGEFMAILSFGATSAASLE